MLHRIPRPLFEVSCSLNLLKVLSVAFLFEKVKAHRPIRRQLVMLSFLAHNRLNLQWETLNRIGKLLRLELKTVAEVLGHERSLFLLTLRVVQIQVTIVGVLNSHEFEFMRLVGACFSQSVDNCLLEMQVDAIAHNIATFISFLDGRRSSDIHSIRDAMVLRAQDALQLCRILLLWVEVKLTDDQIPVLLRWPPGILYSL